MEQIQKVKFRRRHPVWFGLSVAAGTVMALFTAVVVWFIIALATSDWTLG